MAGMPDIALIVPVVLPLLGAGVLLILGEGARRRAYDPLPVLIAGTVFAATLLLWEHSFPEPEVIDWPAIRILGVQLAALVDRFALPFVFSLVLLAIATTIVGDDLGGRKWAMAILLWGGSLTIVVSGNLLTLLLGWILCEVAFLGASVLSRESRLLLYRLAVGAAGTGALFLLTLRPMGSPMVYLHAGLANLSPRWIAAFFAIGAIRMGLYPLHLAGFGPGDAFAAPLVLGRLASAIAGLYLWFRGLATINNLPSQIEYLVVLGGLAALVSAFATWAARNEWALFPWLVGFELGVVIIDLSFATPKLTTLAMLEMMNLLLAGGVFGLGLYAIDRIEGRWVRRWVQGLTFLATASLLGLPPTPGFVARWGLYREAFERGDIAAILPVVVATGLLIPPLFAVLRSKQRYSTPRWSNHALVGLMVLGLPLVLTSVQPLILAPVLDAVTNAASYSIMAHLIRSAGSRMSAKLISLVVIPALAGYSLDRVYSRWRAPSELDPLWDLLSLEWLYDLLASTALRAAIAVSILLAFLELGSALGWVAIAGLLLVLAMLRRGVTP